MPSFKLSRRTLLGTSALVCATPVTAQGAALFRDGKASIEARVAAVGGTGTVRPTARKASLDSRWSY